MYRRNENSESWGCRLRKSPCAMLNPPTVIHKLLPEGQRGSFLRWHGCCCGNIRYNCEKLSSEGAKIVCEREGITADRSRSAALLLPIVRLYADGARDTLAG